MSICGKLHTSMWSRTWIRRYSLRIAKITQCSTYSISTEHSELIWTMPWHLAMRQVSYPLTAHPYPLQCDEEHHYLSIFSRRVCNIFNISSTASMCWSCALNLCSTSANLMRRLRQSLHVQTSQLTFRLIALQWLSNSYLISRCRAPSLSCMLSIDRTRRSYDAISRRTRDALKYEDDVEGRARLRVVSARRPFSSKRTLEEWRYLSR